MYDKKSNICRNITFIFGNIYYYFIKIAPDFNFC